MTLRSRTGFAVAAVLAALAAGMAGPVPAHADSGTARPPGHSITAVGDGIVEGTPNVLDLSLGVTTRDPSAATALAHNSELALKGIDTLERAGDRDKGV